MTAAAEPSPAAGVLFAARYEVEELVGQGTTSQVWAARDRVAGQRVALKVLEARLTWDPAARERLRREVLASRRVAHRAIVRVHDFVVSGERAAIVQELVEGETVAAAVGRQGLFDPPRAIEVASAVVEGLDACHRHGIIHRDVRPGNVLLATSGEGRLIDFGIARVSQLTTVTHTGGLLPAPGSQAPEVLRGERADLRADLYGVGLLLFEMLSGRPPFPPDPGGLRAFAQLQELAPDLRTLRPELSPALAALVADLLHPHPEFRPPGGLAVVERLEELRGASGRPAAPGCRRCGYRRRSVIPVCPSCGLALGIVLRPGDQAVALSGLDQPDEYAQHLRDLFGEQAVSDGPLRARRAEGEALVLVQGVDRPTAEALAADAAPFGTFAAVVPVRKLPRHLGVGGLLLALGLGSGALLLLGLLQMRVALAQGESLLGPAVLLSFLLALGMAGALAWLGLNRTSEALLDASKAAPPPASRPNHLLKALQARLPAGSAGPLAAARASVVEGWWRLRLALPAAARRLVVEGVGEAADQLLDRAFTLEEGTAALAALLQDRSPAVAARDLERALARERVDGDPATAALRAALAEEVRVREDADDTVSATLGRLVLAAGLLQRFARALENLEGIDSHEAELWSLLQDGENDAAAIDRARCRLAGQPVKGEA